MGADAVRVRSNRIIASPCSPTGIGASCLVRVRLATILTGAVAMMGLVSCSQPTQQTNSMRPSGKISAAVGLRSSEPLAASSARVSVTLHAGDTHPISTLLNIRSSMNYGDYYWDEERVAPGPLWVRIDLRRQLMSVFRGPDEIGTTVVLYGADKKPTPLGTFPILARFKDHRSGPYDAPMPYTLRLTPDGVSIHGSNVRWGAATHGCVGVPLEFAKRLFEQVRVGDPVTITNDAPARILPKLS